MSRPDPTRDPSIPWGEPTLRVVLLATALAPFSVALVSPGLPVFRSTFGTTDAGASLLLSAILAPGVLLSPVMGLLTDRIGRRRVLVGSLLAWSLAGGAILGRPPFAAYLLGIPVALYAMRALEEPRHDREPRTLVYLRRVVSALSAREAVVLYGSAFLIDLLLFGAVFTALPFLLSATYGLAPVLIGLVVTPARSPRPSPPRRTAASRGGSPTTGSSPSASPRRDSGSSARGARRRRC